jgi:DNA topoisomerase-3
MSEKGLGTPATRAATIEGLVYEEYIVRHGKDLQATAKAFSLMELLNGLGIPELTRPELTGEWEFRLRQVQRKQLGRPEFMSQIADMTRTIVGRAKQFEHDTIPGDFGVLEVPCPKCGGEVHERYRAFQCVKCDFAIRKTLSGRIFEYEEVEKLITEKKVGPLQGFRSKLGRPFAAVINLTPENKVEFDFGQSREEGAAPVDFTGQEPLGKCPQCQHNVFETPMHYVCERAVGEKRECEFRSGRLICQQPVERAQMQKMLATGKTDLLDKFISKKNRPFKAFLVIKDARVQFAFEPRAAAKGKGGKSREPAPKVDFTAMQPVGACPKCKSKVFETEAGWLCEKSQAASRACKFKLSKTIAQRPIEPEQAAKLMKSGKTDLLKNFTSRAGRPFSAWLVVETTGKVGFEFPDRDDDSGTT